MKSILLSVQPEWVDKICTVIGERNGLPVYEKEDEVRKSRPNLSVPFKVCLIKQQDEQIFQLENRLKECENGYAGTLHIESCKLHDAEERVKELTEENERLNASCTELTRKMQDNVRAENKELRKANEYEVRKVQADTVREIFKEIYSSLDYIEEQMEPEEIPECFFSVREDINALKEKFESEGTADEI